MLFAALLLVGSRFPARPPAPVQELVSIPITLVPLVPAPAPAEEEPVSTAAPRASAPTRPPPVALPSTAITLPAPAIETPVPPAEPPGNVDWFAQSVDRAARYAAEVEAPPATIGNPPQKMREPCKPRESSFKWKSDSRPTGLGALTPGWEEPEPDKHLFDDMMAGRRSKSSVPDPNVCD